VQADVDLLQQGAQQLLAVLVGDERLDEPATG
jgi:hypothetical protein